MSDSLGVNRGNGCTPSSIHTPPVTDTISPNSKYVLNSFLKHGHYYYAKEHIFIKINY